MNEGKWSNLRTMFLFLSDSDMGEPDTDKERRKLRFKCILCLPKEQSIACDSTSLSNLRRHISRTHPSQVIEYDRLSKRKSVNQGGPPSKQVKIDYYGGASTTIPPSQKELDQLIIRHIIDDCQPLTLIRSKSFRDLILRLAPKRSIMCYESLIGKIEDNFDRMKNNLKEEFTNAGSVSITADGWSCGTKAFIGITVHWLDSELKRKSAALACRRIVGRHTYDVIASSIEEILVEFRIHNKTSGATTDNGSNFVKAFRLFAENDEDEKESQNTGGDELIFHEITDELNEFGGGIYHLPPHYRCAAHTINLIATQDTKKAQESPALTKVARSAFATCQMIWNKQSRSTSAADKIRDMLGCLFIIPVPTRWNSMYYAMVKVRKLIQKSDDNLGALTDALGIKKRFNEREVAFICEYCDVMCPLATALNILECEKHMFLGYLLPTIATVEKQLRSLQDQLTYCTCLVQGILEGLDKRFGEYYSNKNLFWPVSLSQNSKQDGSLMKKNEVWLYLFYKRR